MSLQFIHFGIFILQSLFISSALATMCCPDNWVAYHNSCYLFTKNTPLSFYEAEHYCIQHGGHLVQLETKAESLFVYDFLRGMIAQYYWLGITDELIEGIWEWYHSHQEATFTVIMVILRTWRQKQQIEDWRPGEPDSYGGNEDCAIMAYESQYKWVDVQCGRQFLPICEMEVGQSVIVG